RWRSPVRIRSGPPSLAFPYAPSARPDGAFLYPQLYRGRLECPSTVPLAQSRGEPQDRACRRGAHRRRPARGRTARAAPLVARPIRDAEPILQPRRAAVLGDRVAGCRRQLEPVADIDAGRAVAVRAP